MDVEELKRLAGEKAVGFVQPGMVIGLGTGSTAVHAVRKIGRMWQAGELPGIVCIPTSEVTACEAEKFGIPLTTLNEQPEIDITIDGADEIDPHFDLIKGLGGALLREKIVAAASRRMVVVSDYRKQVAQLGTRAPVPVEVIPFAQRPVTDYLQTLAARVEMRMAGTRPFRTDEQNIILDCTFDGIPDPAQLAQAIRAQPGVVEHGLFLGLAADVILAAPDGVVWLRK
ncbi:MAG: ribose-5-phosphate isomerase RpiA [Chloroflexi bacterium]|nr:ribose-5-phosphate isomerase RpiA [Chloroflexota bacterium]